MQYSVCPTRAIFEIADPYPENESVAPVHSVASGEKEKIMLPISDQLTCQG